MDFSWYETTDLGMNSHALHTLAQSKTGGIFVDLGVREGASSGLMSDRSKELRNKVYGVDVDLSLLNPALVEGQNYKTILGDSSTVGKRWTHSPKVDILFVDTLHVKEQVLVELYSWSRLMNPGSYIVFHDSHWPEGKKETFGDIIWDTPAAAIKEYFGLTELVDQEDEFIEVKCYPDSWGMTFVRLKRYKDFTRNISDWKIVFDRRNQLTSLFWNESTIGNRKIDLAMRP